MNLLRWVALFLLLLTAARADATYSGETPREGGANWRHTLILKDNGSAVFRTIKSRRSGVMENGRWTKTEGGGIALQFLDRQQQPRGGPVVWSLAGRELTPVSWDKADWGAEQPPTLRAN